MYDYSLFTRDTGFDFLSILVYVDDIVCVGPNPTIIKSATTLLHNHFKLKYLGHLIFVSRIITISIQAWYILVSKTLHFIYST